uniref:Reverse transcriptase domain-containing protein n=1 Tax=Amphimedon queenslandica TaxID=400682 RepID=A0A1X7TFD1_AMPQE
MIGCHLEQFENTHKETVRKIRESIYVDDIIMGAQSESEALKLYQESKAIFSNGGFNLRKFTTNCQVLQGKIDEMEQCKEKTGADES